MNDPIFLKMAACAYLLSWFISAQIDRLVSSMVDLMFVKLVNERTKIWLSNLISSAMKREFKVRSLLCIGFKGFTSPWHSWGKKRIIERAMGDAVYLMQCKPVQVHIAIPKFCSDELPVLWTIPISILYVAHEFWQNKPQNFFFSELTPVMYKIDGIWYKSDGKTLTETKTPQNLVSCMNLTENVLCRRLFFLLLQKCCAKKPINRPTNQSISQWADIVT